MMRHRAAATRRLLAVLTLALWPSISSFAAERPNIVLIYADDLGYGDVGCYGATTIPTPNLDRLADEGLRFTSGYAPAATCTPSRYAMLTGEYAWRHPGTGIAPPNSPALIKPGRFTLASMLRNAGYATAIVGKWHLGLGEPPKPDWSGELKPGPLELGFDYSFILPTTNDRVPCVYVENHRVVDLDPDDPIDVFVNNPDGQPTGRTHRDSLKMDWSIGHNFSIVNGIGRIGFMTGGHAARWVDEDMVDVFVGKAKELISQPRDKPFFLFYSAHEIHVPRAPHARFVGQTPHGPRGDAIVEMDWIVGEIVQTLEATGVADNTLVIFTSDNGPVLDDGYKDDAVEKLGDHRPAGPWRGGKYSNYEGGTRVPWIIRWPAKVRPGVSDAVVCQVDLIASLRSLVQPDRPLPADAAPDSHDVLAALMGQAETGRDHLVTQARSLGLRAGRWKFISSPVRPSAGKPNNSPGQLFDLETDPGETDDLAAKLPDRAAQMADHLETIRKAGRSRP